MMAAVSADKLDKFTLIISIECSLNCETAASQYGHLDRLAHNRSQMKTLKSDAVLFRGGSTV